MSIVLFSKNTVGLDLTDRTVEIVEMTNAGDIVKKSRIALAKGIVERGRIKDRAKLVDLLTAVFGKAKIGDFSRKTLAFAMPERQTFIHIFDIRKDEQNFEEAIKDEIVAVIPLEFESIAYGYSLCEKEGTGSYRVTLIAAQRQVVAEWKSFMESFGFEKVLIGAEAFASYIGLGVEEKMLPVCIVDIGAVTTIMGVYDAYGACFASSMDKGGDLVTRRAVATSGLKFEQVELLKFKYGLNGVAVKTRALKKETETAPTVKKKSIVGLKDVEKAFKSVSDEIIAQLEENLHFCKEKYGIDIANVVLIGGTSQAPGLLEYFRHHLEKNVIKGKYAIKSDSNNIYYVEAIGLASYEKSGKIFPLFDMKLEEGNVSIQKSVKKAKPKEKEKIKPKKKEEDEDDSGLIEGEEVHTPVAMDRLLKPITDEAGAEKMKKQKRLLVIVLIFGAILIESMYWFRSQESLKHQQDIAAKTILYTHSQTVDFVAPIVIAPEKIEGKSAAGRFVDDKIEIIGEQAEAVEVSRLALAKGLSGNEALWPDPLSVALTDSSTHPDGRTIRAFSITWLVYDLEEVHKLFYESLAAGIDDKTANYSVSSIERPKIAATSNKNIYNMLGVLTISSEKEIIIHGQDETALKTEYGQPTAVATPTDTQTKDNVATTATDTANTTNNMANNEVKVQDTSPKAQTAAANPTGQTATQPAAENVQTMTVAVTETGWLNVRQSPTTTATIITKIYTGETYEVLETKTGWVRLKLKDGNSGWAVTRYLK
jgi:cell division ATPase FtsA